MNENYPSTVLKAAQKIKMVLLDVDGVLTDGRLYYANSGEELKAFDIQDGLGIKLLQEGGIEVGIITGRTSELLKRRTDELNIQLLVQGREDKLTALNEILVDSTINLEEIAFVGDDLPDLAIIRRVGLGITPANGNHIVASQALWQTQKSGGNGAVREVAELILSAQNKLNALLEPYQ
ncbi:HAD-IIIA family hydrolase [Porticoccaceae bacterium]|nr:HAD-IIIA family hydrolase [Porticoccaceae bacterium]MDA9014902.1 HAD-IIIA family hydrolase [Porticoccaceae bacterium]